MPVQGIANMVLKRTKEDVCSAIDEQIKSSVDLRSMVDSLWQSLYQPMLLSEEYRSAESGFQLLIRADIPFAEAEKMANENLQGYTYEEGRRKVTVDSIHMRGQGNKLVVELDLSGSYQGKMHLTGKPEISPDSTAISFEKLDYRLETRNLLHKSAGWLLKGPIKKQISKSIDYYMEYYLKYFKNCRRPSRHGTHGRTNPAGPSPPGWPSP